MAAEMIYNEAQSDDDNGEVQDDSISMSALSVGNNAYLDSQDEGSVMSINVKKRKRSQNENESKDESSKKKKKKNSTKSNKEGMLKVPAPPKPTSRELEIRMEGDRTYFTPQDLLLNNSTSPIPSAKLFENEESSCEEEIEEELGDQYVRPSQALVHDFCLLCDYKSTQPGEINVINKLKQQLMTYLKNFSKNTVEVSKMMHAYYKRILPGKDYSWPHMTSYRFGIHIEVCMQNEPIVRLRLDLAFFNSMIFELRKRIMYRNQNGTTMFNNSNDAMLRKYEKEKDKLLERIPIQWRTNDSTDPDDSGPLNTIKRSSSQHSRIK